jgi:glutamate carboxypeptidase
MQAITNRIFSKLTVSEFTPTMSLTNIAFLPPLNRAKTTYLFGLLKQLESMIGFEIKEAHVGYGSDGNNISDLPLNILVGLGPFGGGMNLHSW